MTPGLRSFPRARRRTRIVLAGLVISGLAALAWARFGSPSPRLVYNPSDSVPVGWYAVHPFVRGTHAISVGSVVLAWLPHEAAVLAARRDYLPRQVPLLKPVAAVAPETVCVTGGVVRIDGRPVAAVLSVDGRGRPLHAWNHCRRLHAGELFLLSTSNPASYDSRYFGPVRTSSVLGIAHPIWLEKQP